MRCARLPAVKTLADVDFTFQPSVKREQIESLPTLGFLERKENVVLLEPPGVRKTHLARASNKGFEKWSEIFATRSWRPH